MKPNDLIIPFSWKDRKSILLDRLLYIPSNYTAHDPKVMPAFANEQIFGNNNPVHVELCSGNGQWIVERAQENPNINWVAVEIRFDRARKIWVKMHNKKLNNLFVVLGDARTYLKLYIEKESISHLFVNFPDPWPKKKHAKHRLISKGLFDDLDTVVYPQGKVILATDDVTYSELMIQAGQSSDGWEPSFSKPHYKLEWPDYGTSFFSNLWQGKGLHIRYMQFEKSTKLGSDYE